MATGKRASMREGPLAALFRKTETDGLEDDAGRARAAAGRRAAARARRAVRAARRSRPPSRAFRRPRSACATRSPPTSRTT